MCRAGGRRLIDGDRGRGNQHPRTSRNWGAVHIELKHEVPNWAEALTCMRFAISYGEDEPGDKGRINYRYRFGNAQVIVVTGELGIITAYPTGNNVSKKWSQCAAS